MSTTKGELASGWKSALILRQMYFFKRIRDRSVATFKIFSYNVWRKRSAVCWSWDVSTSWTRRFCANLDFAVVIDDLLSTSPCSEPPPEVVINLLIAPSFSESPSDRCSTSMMILFFGLPGAGVSRSPRRFTCKEVIEPLLIGIIYGSKFNTEKRLSLIAFCFFMPL